MKVEYRNKSKKEKNIFGNSPLSKRKYALVDNGFILNFLNEIEIENNY